ncbi:unnamed protein product [Toxocara canis]|uniref:Ground-like domain-containing protein n=1 Tax=Toxocara canis TaxID=6265 RepID=A0A183TZ11_TOXCA|nr:unnamed protein product [Toxocara canis]
MWYFVFIFVALITSSCALFFGCFSPCSSQICCCTCQIFVQQPQCNCPIPISAVPSSNYVAPSNTYVLPQLATYLPSPGYQMGATLDASYEYRPQVSPAADRGHKPPQQWPITGPQQPSINVSIMHRGVTKPTIFKPSIVVQEAKRDKDSCYITSGGYKCCSLNLEDAMNAAYNELSQKPDFNDCNIDLIAKVIQRAAQEKFGMSFETIVALNDFAGKSAYEGNLTCKFKLHGKYIHSYATPVQYDVRERVIEQAFSNADVTHNIIVGPSTEGVDEEEKQRRIDELNRLGLGGSRSPNIFTLTVTLYERVLNTVTTLPQ